MKKIEITWKGVTPLIMHSCQCVNPLHPIAKQIKEITSKRKKVEEDLIKLSDLEWEGSVYWDKENNCPYLPAENIEATIKNGAKVNKKGKDIEKYFNVITLRPEVFYGEKLEYDDIKMRNEYRDVRVMTIQRSKILRTRARFDMWQATFIALYDDEKLDLDVIVAALEYAGAYVGVCDSRPKYGKFVSTIKEID